MTATTSGFLGDLSLEDLAGAPSLPDLRRDALGYVASAGFPTTKHEDWRYTRLGALLETPFVLPAELTVDDDGVATLARDLGPNRLVFVNGRLDARNSNVAELEQGVVATSIAAALADDPDRLRPLLSRRAVGHHAFASLNLALFVDGAYVELAPDTVVDGAIHLVYVASSPDAAVVVSPRSLVIAGTRSRASIVEHFVGSDGEVYLDNSFTDIILEEGAQIDHFKVQIESERAFHLATLDVHQGRDSRFASSSVALGGAIGRHEVQIRLEEEGAEVDLRGLFVGHGEQQLDNPTLVEHVGPRCVSRELYKGVVSEKARGVFNGRVVVHPDAIGTDASQVNKNLLLSETAEVDTRPRLEILADDVKVSHGAAVGQLDEEARFYLRSRGIPDETARALLVSAFVDETLQNFPERELARLQALVAARVAPQSARRDR